MHGYERFELGEFTYVTTAGGGSRTLTATIQDAGGNTVTSDSTDKVQLTTSSQVLTCSANPATASSGVVRFSGCYYTHKATGETLKATSPTTPVLSPATSTPFDIN